MIRDKNVVYYAIQQNYIYGGNKMSKEYFKAGFWMMIGMAVAGTLVNYVGDWARKEVAKSEDQKEKPEGKSKADVWEESVK